MKSGKNHIWSWVGEFALQNSMPETLSRLNHVCARCTLIVLAWWQLFSVFPKNGGKKLKYKYENRMQNLQQMEAERSNGRKTDMIITPRAWSIFICSIFFFVAWILLWKLSIQRQATARTTSYCTRECHVLACQKKKKTTTQHERIWHCIERSSLCDTECMFRLCLGD